MRQIGTTSSPKAAVLDLLTALAAVGGLTATVLLDFPVRVSPFAASDFKTLYASAWCFRHGSNAYSFTNLASVFRAQGVVPPANWFGHAPVYPPSALAVLAPLTWLSMVHATYLATILSALLFALAVGELLGYARREFALSLPWRAAIAVLCAISPLLAFALGLGNLSVAAAALCLLAFVGRSRVLMWVPVVLLAGAMLLKPHLALWMAIAFIFSPEQRSRRIAIYALATAILTGIATSFALARGTLLTQVHAFFAMVQRETATGGSMSITSHEPLPIVSQVTSLRSLVGFWIVPAWVSFLLAAGLLSFLFLYLAYRSLRVQNEQESSFITGAWIAFGLLTTYHRAHDALLLLVLAPWLVHNLRCTPKFWKPWAVLLLFGTLSLGPALTTITHRAFDAGTSPVLKFLFLRQAGLADLGLVLILLLPRLQAADSSRRDKGQPLLHAVT
ncbi:MAG: glycosyltransferase family 87 protein [Janthinobacterium lividum]